MPQSADLPSGPRPAPPPAPAKMLLEVEDLSVSFAGQRVVDGVGISLAPGEILGIVGESGSGKSITALAIMRLLPKGGRLSATRMRLMGEDLLTAPESRLEEMRGSSMGMIFQEPMTALNPVLTIGEQVSETARRHLRLGAREARDRSIEMLRRVGIPSAEYRIDDYPHRLSGGMRQRVMIAMALICRPKLLIADEPTTALDVTIQAQILDLMLDLQEEYRMGIILISHDLGVVSAFTDRVMIMYLGRTMETAPAGRIFETPRHPYTEALLASIPDVNREGEALKAIKGTVPAVDDLPPGCRFAPRCDDARPECDAGTPPLVAVAPGHRAACIRSTGYRFEADPL